MESPEGSSVARSDAPDERPAVDVELKEAAPIPVQGRPLSRKERKQLLRMQRTTISAEFYAGLIPHPEHLERIEKLQPGATDRLIRMAETQGEHRQAMERKFLNFNGVSQILGTIVAGIIALGSVGGSIYLLATGHSIVQFTAMLTPLAAIIWAFRRTQKNQSKEIARKK